MAPFRTNYFLEVEFVPSASRKRLAVMKSHHANALGKSQCPASLTMSISILLSVFQSSQNCYKCWTMKHWYSSLKPQSARILKVNLKPWPILTWARHDLLGHVHISGPFSEQAEGESHHRLRSKKITRDCNTYIAFMYKYTADMYTYITEYNIYLFLKSIEKLPAEERGLLIEKQDIETARQHHKSIITIHEEARPHCWNYLEHYQERPIALGKYIPG